MSFTEKSKHQLSKQLTSILKDITTPNTNGRKGPLMNGVIAGVTDASGTVYLHGEGVKDIESGDKVDINNQLSMFSCTKTMTLMAVLILWDRNQIDIDAAAGTYLPEIDEIGMITKGQVNRDDGTFKTPPVKPKTPVTVRHLMLHTAGFSYGFLSKDYLALQMKRDIHINVVYPTRELFTTDKFPLVHEPGTKWNYGHNTDWLGLVVEAISGQTLGEFLRENVFEPSGMTHTTFHLDSDENLIKLHRRHRDKEVTLMHKYQVALDPAVDMGGQGAFSTVGDYLRLIRIWLNYGVSPDTGKRILKQSTVEFAIQNHLPDGLGVNFGDLGFEYPPGWTPDGFTLTGNAYTSNPLPTGRPKGVIYWSGLANLYYWIDMENGIGGFWGSQIFPYMDKYSLLNYVKFEMTVYDALGSAKKEKKRTLRI